jgi:hypothetical protein
MRASRCAPSSLPLRGALQRGIAAERAPRRRTCYPFFTDIDKRSWRRTLGKSLHFYDGAIVGGEVSTTLAATRPHDQLAQIQLQFRLMSLSQMQIGRRPGWQIGGTWMAHLPGSAMGVAGRLIGPRSAISARDGPTIASVIGAKAATTIEWSFEVWRMVSPATLVGSCPNGKRGPERQAADPTSVFSTTVLADGETNQDDRSLRSTQ